MAEHYYTNAPTSAHEERHVSVQLGNRCLRFETDAGTFSKQHLDPGSRLLIDTVPPLSGRCADIGCGWGAIGVALAVKNPALTVEMVDVNERAVALAQK
ncbi:MAG: class I SAM-dependent methyltransferase, partial [Candidatus Spyradocola sp.]